ncbi:MAG: GGDEF domain-containing protein, partial [Eubacteriales bacterium]
TKTYCISLLFVFMATVLFIAHNVFAASYVFFIFAIILTTIYANSMLTTITACLSVLLMIVSELFIPWDADKVSIFESTQRLGEFAIALFILFAIFAVSLTEIHYNRKKNEASMQKEIHRQALEHRLKIDELTGVFSRKALLDAMDEMETNKADNRYVFAIADIDHFKDINDKYGHHIGDYYLVTFADILKKHCKACSVFRYGGDEFCLLFKNITLDEAVALCKGIQQSVKKISIPNHPEIQHTVSFGLAVHATDLSTDELFLRADKALYAAKQTRNTIKTY